MYKNNLQNNLTKDFDDELPLAWIFQHDNNLNHTSRAVKAWFAKEKIRVLDWPAQSSDLNPIVNLWVIVKLPVATKKKPSSKKAILAAYPGRKALVRSSVAKKGYPTKY